MLVNELLKGNLILGPWSNHGHQIGNHTK